MAAAALTEVSFGRIAPLGNLSGILVTVVATATVYASASGGLPVDLTGVLAQGSPNNADWINPQDVVGVLPAGSALSTNGYLPIGLTKGTFTFTAQTGATYNIAGPPATVPCWIRLMGIGAAVTNHAGFGEPADGAVTETFSFLLIIARGGSNNGLGS